MANTLKHKKVSTVPDSGNSRLVQPTNWNEEHVFAGGADGQVLTRDSGQSDGVTWTTPASPGSATVNSPAQITSDQNNYNPSNADIWRLTSDQARTITGIAAASDGTRRTIVNVGSFDITLADQNSSSSAANRIITGINTNIIIGPNGSVRIWYDNTTSRWRVES